MTERIIQTRYLEKLFRALQEEESHHFHLPVKGLRADITALLVHLPAFKTMEGQVFEANGFNSPEAFLAQVQQMPGEAVMKGDDVLVIYYPADVPANKFETLVVFSTSNGPVVYYLPVYQPQDMVRQLSTAVPVNTLNEEARAHVLEHLEIAMIALLREFHISIARAVVIPDILQPRAPEEEITALKKLITLLAQDVYEEDSDLDIIAHALYHALSAPSSFAAFHPDFFEEEEMIETDEEGLGLFRYVLQKFVPTVYSAPEFDAADIEYYITELTGEDFVLALPEEEPQGRQLFPFVQQQLTTTGWQLMNMDTAADSYCFFVVKLEDVSTVLQLARQFNLDIEHL